MRPVGKSHKRSHHSGCNAKVGFVAPAIKPGTLSKSSTLVRSVYGNACRTKPRSKLPEPREQAASTASATLEDGRLCPIKMMRFWVRRALSKTMIGWVVGPLVVRCGWRGLKGCGEVECGLLNIWMSLIREKSPTHSTDTAVGIFTGIGILLYGTTDSNSCVSLGRPYRGRPGIDAAA